MAIFTSAALGAGLISLGSGFLATVSAIALNAAVGIGLQLAVASLNKPDAPEPLGVRGKMQSGGDVPRSLIMGRRASAGSLVYANTWGQAGKTPNAYFTQVISLSDMPVSGMTAMWVNGEPVTVDTSDASVAGTFGYPVTEYRTGSRDHLWVKFYDGTQTAADSWLVSNVSSAARPYENTRVGRGIAYAVVTARSNPELFSGFPSFRFELQGMPLYDVSKDSTAGGSGAHRWDNPATWGGDGDDLPAVQVYNIMRGIRYNGDWLYGLQNTPAARFPASDWISQIAKCRLQVEGPNGLEAQYMTGAEIAVGTEIGTCIETILMGCQGRPIETGGIYKIRVGEPGNPSFAFTDADIISTVEQTNKPFLGLADSINGITARYPEPEESWNVKPAPPLYRADYEARDGNRRLVSDLDLTTVSRSRQVQQIMKAALAEARRERRHTLVLPPAFWTAEPGDVCTWTSARNGYVSKLFRVDGVADRTNLDVMVDVTEVDPTDYQFNFFTDYRPPVFSPISPDRPPAQPMEGWQVFPATIYDAQGNARRPSIQVNCAADQDDVRNVWIQVRLKASGLVVFDSDATAYAPPHSWTLNGVFLPLTEYQVRGRFVPYSNRPMEWSAWLDVTTPDVKLAPGLDFDPYEGVTGFDNLDEDLAGYQEWLGSGVREIRERMEEIDSLLADQDFGNALDRQKLREQVTATFEGARAEYMREVQVLATADAALATRIESLTATVGVNKAEFLSQVQVLVNADTALSQSINSLSTNFGSFQSSVNSRLVALSDADEALALSVDELEAQVFDPATGLPAVASAVSGLQSQVSTIDGRVTSLATALTSVTAASSSGDVNTANFRMAAMSGPSGYSRIGAQARQGGAGAWRAAAWYLDVPNNTALPTRFLVEADQFIVVAGNNLNNPFVVDGNAVRMNVANIGTVNAGRMLALNGKVDFNLNAGTLEFYS
ncbi:MAG: phage tail protein [Shinella sp.]|nr:phage tail protein [Shinella sp.]